VETNPAHLAEAHLVRSADPCSLGTVRQQPGAIVGKKRPTCASGGKRKRALAGSGFAAEQNAGSITRDQGRVQRSHIALRQQHVSNRLQKKPAQQTVVRSGLLRYVNERTLRADVHTREIVGVGDNRQQMPLQTEGRLACRPSLGFNHDPKLHRLAGEFRLIFAPAFVGGVDYVRRIGGQVQPKTYRVVRPAQRQLDVAEQWVGPYYSEGVASGH
jgi:hypothetical protein